MLKPEGRPLADHVYGVFPPVAATVVEYAAPAAPFGSDAVVIEGAAAIAIARFADAVRCVGEVESVTVMAAVLVPDALGVPEICPVLLLIPRPAGKPVADQA